MGDNQVSAARAYEALALHLAWLLMTVLRFAGIIIVIAGVALFGVYFIGGNARATDGHVPVSSWLGVGPKKAMRIVGSLMLLAAFVITFFIPNGL
jgi:hypothetical protein